MCSKSTALIVGVKQFCVSAFRRAQVAEFFRQQTPCLIGIEATQGAHYWARVLRALGHEVRLVAPQFVKPYLKSQKNDANDAEAICEAVSRPSMRFVPSKSIEQQDLQALHRIRSRMIGSRTQLGNQIRGLLAEYGIVLPLHLSQVRTALPQLIEEDDPLLSAFGRQLLAALYEELCALEQRINKVEEQVQQIHRSNALCQKIAAVEGIGPVTATGGVFSCPIYGHTAAPHFSDLQCVCLGCTKMATQNPRPDNHRNER